MNSRESEPATRSLPAAADSAPLPGSAPRRRRRRWKTTWSWELLLVVYAVYDGSRLLVKGAQDRAMRHGRDILSLERHLHLSPEHWINHTFYDHAWLGVPADYLYATLHYVLTVGVLFWLWRFHRVHYRQARTWLGLTTMIGLVGFITFPTAPPRMLGPSYDFVDTLAEHADIGWWGGGGGTPKGFADVTNEFAAMPSLHVGWALWCGLLLFRHARSQVVRVLGLLYPLVIAMVVMGTANHYLLDAIAGVTVALIGLWWTDPLLRLTARVGARMRRRRSGALSGAELSLALPGPRGPEEAGPAEPPAQAGAGPAEQGAALDVQA
ncbi:phosphatase PAP2 family protein [Streptacidiphilus cavernicola]|uniref:Phosphatase PAP2 family protein n=1 Tax=Streptacidiphilus cavernicola TaxID=3342716 RepID=A0ABV6W495_9ACTN